MMRARPEFCRTKKANARCLIGTPQTDGNSEKSIFSHPLLLFTDPFDASSLISFGGHDVGIHPSQLHSSHDHGLCSPLYPRVGDREVVEGFPMCCLQMGRRDHAGTNVHSTMFVSIKRGHAIRSRHSGLIN